MLFSTAESYRKDRICRFAEIYVIFLRVIEMSLEFGKVVSRAIFVIAAAFFTAIFAVTFCFTALAAAESQRSTNLNIATFSVVAFDPHTGETGVAVQSKFFAVGSVVPWCSAGAGAVATQAYGQTTYGPLALEMMEDGMSPAEALEKLLAADEDRERRQIGIVKASGAGMPLSSADAPVTYTGAECMEWAGGKTGVTPDGIIYSVQGNILAGQEVVEAMAWAIEQPPEITSADFAAGLPYKDSYEIGNEGLRALDAGDFPGRLLRALIAGQAAGGDARGMQSAALKVAQEGAGYGGYNDVKYDLRVDDAKDPFEELARLLNLARPIALTFEAYNRLYANELERAIEIFESLADIEPENASHHYNLACAYALSGRAADALRELEFAIKLDPMLIPHARQDPDLESLHPNPEFERILAEAGD